jgi:nicotinate-nucleotide adenylyltransferase
VKDPRQDPRQDPREYPREDPRSPRQTLAIYGGSFDPPHVGHTLAAAFVLASQPVDQLIVVPTARHPFAKQLAPFQDRVEMCRLAMRDLKRVEVSTIEDELDGPSLTLRTLESLAARSPSAQLRFIIGSDLVAETSSWHGFDRVCALAPLIVVNRAGFPQAHEGGPALPEISSSDLRERLRMGRSTEGWLSPQVAQYAIERGLYR